MFNIDRTPGQTVQSLPVLGVEIKRGDDVTWTVPLQQLTRKHGSSLWPMHRGNDARLPEQRPVPRLARDNHAATHVALISGGVVF